MPNYFLGLDIGSSSIKAALVCAETGRAVATAQSTEEELAISSPYPGWAEQDPDMWWQHVQIACAKLKEKVGSLEGVLAIGITYQMHGLVLVDKDMKPLRPSIIWCDGRAVGQGEAAAQKLGHKFSLEHYLNLPGNFTASKMRWVIENEPEVAAQVRYMMLPGDYIALKLGGEVVTTTASLSEGILYDYSTKGLSTDLMAAYQIEEKLIPQIKPIMGEQGCVNAESAQLLGIKAGTSITYRAGDQPNNAFALSVLEPGEAAANAGTSGVIYAVTDKALYDEKSRVNAFLHVTHTDATPRYGVLACLNGTGILNSWLRKILSASSSLALSYERMNQMAAEAPLGSNGLRIYPFGNGAERFLENQDPGASFRKINFLQNDAGTLARASQEGIVYALNYGLDIMKQMGMTVNRVKAGNANMFLSPLFRQVFADVTGAEVSLHNADGSIGAACAAGVGLGHWRLNEAHQGLETLTTITPSKESRHYQELYMGWKDGLAAITK